MSALTSRERREIDRLAVEETGPGLLQMMENAGRSMAVLALRKLRDIYPAARAARQSSSIFARCPLDRARRASLVTRVASRASARATYAASYAVRVSLNSQTRGRSTECG